MRKFAPYSRKAIELGKKVIPLNIGQPDLQTPKVYFEAIKQIKEGVIAYAPSEGIDELREGFAKYYAGYNMPFEKNDIFITNGGSEALLYTIGTLCDEGDEILAFEPFYPNYNTIAKVMGAKLVSVMTKAEENFRLPGIEEVQKKITDKTKAILITNPNNPTGLVLRRDEIEMLIEVALSNDLFIIADEVYREFTYDGTQYISFTEYPRILDRLVIVDSVSKRFSGCGIRIGCVASLNKEFMSNILKLCQSRLSVPTVEQIGAAALFGADDSIIKYAVEQYKIRRDVCVEILSKMDEIDFKCPEGAFYFILTLPLENADDFSGWLLSEFDIDGETAMLCPASDCYADPERGKNQVRISYCIDEQKLRRGMIVLQEGIRAYNKSH